MSLYRKLFDTVTEHMKTAPADPQIAVIGVEITMFVFIAKLQQLDPQAFNERWQMAISALSAQIAAEELPKLDAKAAEGASKKVLDRLAEITKDVNSEK